MPIRSVSQRSMVICPISSLVTAMQRVESVDIMYNYDTAPSGLSLSHTLGGGVEGGQGAYSN